jgi:hypothetical protein
MRDPLRTSLMSGLILDAILFAYLVISGVASVVRNWEASQEKATGLAAVAGMGAELVISGLLFGSAGALATYLALKWAKLDHQ